MASSASKRPGPRPTRGSGEGWAFVGAASSPRRRSGAAWSSRLRFMASEAGMEERVVQVAESGLRVGEGVEHPLHARDLGELVDVDVRGELEGGHVLGSPVGRKDLVNQPDGAA